jgi:excisionase family DNA binding protein
MMTDKSEYMTMQEVMDELCVSRSTVDLYARDGKLTRYQRGRRVIFLRKEVEALNEPKLKTRG